MKLTSIIDGIKTGVQRPRGIVAHLLRKFTPHYGTDWRRQGDFITFEEGGFAASGTRPEFAARHNYESRYLRSCLEGAHFSKSLEIGCGYGRFSPLITSFSDNHSAIDINRNTLLTATQLTKANYFQGSATRLPFKDGSFDLVITWTVLQHLNPEQFRQAAEEINRILMESASLVLCEAVRYPEEAGGHIWDRHQGKYEDYFSDFVLKKASDIIEIDSTPTMESPGRVMLFQRKSNRRVQS